MFEVTATHSDGRQRKKIVFTMDRARHLAHQALEKQWKVQITQLYADVWIVDHRTGHIMLFRSRVSHAEACKRTRHYMRIDQDRGCVMWPHGKPIPKGWRVVKVDS
ncbi:hypothetical protein VN12_04070 [Pirellula sp. SH-Sr6A]|uniref:hypothetical protein n=1 Tax=Pirellula sp. SH-Sr6A TaxID=1632865 RepID=UPI00078CB8F7|nr:hypothetical protein [Pirellula sp. SH-Sr6A]AMV31270.1 hypothetical protein VN12_04070 [Pirellula sp. SH-Sr6A]